MLCESFEGALTLFVKPFAKTDYFENHESVNWSKKKNFSKFVNKYAIHFTINIQKGSNSFKKKYADPASVSDDFR